MSCDHRYRVEPEEGKVLTGQVRCRLCGDVRMGGLLIAPTEEDAEKDAWYRTNKPEMFVG